jgi:hypothetical protein
MTAEGEGVREVVLRGRFARPFAVCWFALAAYLAVDVLRAGEGRTRWLTLAVLLLLTAVVYAVSFRPAVVYDDSRLVLRNIVRDVAVPWPRVTGLDWRYVLTVEVDDDKRYAAWALTANRSDLPSRLRQRRLEERYLPPAMRPGAAPAADPHGLRRPPTLVELVQERWRERRRQAPDGPVEVRWMWPVLGSLAVPAGAVLALTVL